MGAEVDLSHALLKKGFWQPMSNNLPSESFIELM